jgi:thiosulfate reductase cytochrome b subunit
MTQTADIIAAPPGAAPVIVYRHTLLVRLTHWVNAVTLAVLLMSGLNIFGSHPALYWGQQSHFDRPALAIGALRTPDGAYHGVTTIGGRAWRTTGWLGLEMKHGQPVQRAFPPWITLPSYRDLATARHWHFFFAWVLVLNGLAYVAGAVASGHLRRDLWTPPRQLKTIPHEIWNHLRLRFPEGEAARHYNVLQKLSYFGVAFVLLPLIILTGLTMSPGMDAALHNALPTLFGGRQSARTIHFICAGLLTAFVVVHIVMVLISGVGNNLRSMITGRYALPRPHRAREREAGR